MAEIYISLRVYIDGKELVGEEGKWVADDPRARAAEVLRQSAIQLEAGR